MISGPGSPHPRRPGHADARIGGRLRIARNRARLSRDDVAVVAGVSWQQIAKYETGLSRIAASTLERLAINLRIDVAWFFDDAAQEGAIPSQEGAELAGIYDGLPEHHRALLLRLAQILAR